MANNQTLTGVQNNPDGVILTAARAGKQGDTVVSELHGRYYEQTYRGNMYSVANQALVTPVGLTATYTGLALENPWGSQKNLVVNKAAMVQGVIQATNMAIYSLAIGSFGSSTVTHTTPVTIQNNFRGGASTSSVAYADASASLVNAPVIYLPMANSATVTQNNGTVVIDLEGSLILGPGTYVCWVQTGTAPIASSCLFGFQWEEVPV